MTPTHPEDTNGWDEYRRLVVDSLGKIEARLQVIEDKQGKIATEIALLKLKSSIWGATGAGIVILIKLISEHVIK